MLSDREIDDLHSIIQTITFKNASHTRATLPYLEMNEALILTSLSKQTFTQITGGGVL